MEPDKDDIQINFALAFSLGAAAMALSICVAGFFFALAPLW